MFETQESSDAEEGMMPLEDLVWLVSMSGVPISDLTLLIGCCGKVSIRTYVTYASVTLGMAS